LPAVKRFKPTSEYTKMRDSILEKEDKEPERLEERKSNDNKSESKSGSAREIAEMRKQLPEMESTVNENVYHVLLKLWAKLIAGTLGIATVFAMAGFAIATFFRPYFGFLSPIFNTATLENTVETVLAPSVTVIGLVLGFSPVISFFFVNSLKDDQRN
jgi:hypothetical protein